MRRRAILAAVICLSTGITHGALLAEVEFLGFSGDGNYVAMAQHWICDGTGAPGAELVILSLSDGSLFRRYRVRWPEEWIYDESRDYVFDQSVNQALDSVLAEASPVLDSLSISGQDMGIHCVHHPLTDISVDPSRVEFLPWIVYPSYSGAPLSVEIDNVPDPLDDESFMDMWGDPVLLELTVSEVEGSTLLHHMDSEQPPDHGYVWEYRIRDIYMYGGDGIAVVLNSMEPGFEGPDGMFRLVAGRLDH